ncbi:hypothetical protein BU17DRAFT_100736 [Hysterangium stoloniferum]|nr:hypothetical protein BU17DRAFT_100736 [Hysterangium stoloniferum]
MAAIIKNKCVDGWGDGSGGTKDAGPVIFPLGKIKTQRAIHYEHYSDGFKTFEEIYNAQMANNAAEADSVIGVAAVVAFRTCKFNDEKYKGQPIIQTFEHAYRLIWTEWFKAIEHVTNKNIKFKALHKEGKHAIFMVDGSAPQIQGLGDFLLTQNDPLSHLQHTLPMEKMDEFTACTYTIITYFGSADWWWNKLAYPLYIPALCHHFSKVPSADWDLGPTNTNLNEQSHQATNRATGVHIPLAEAIDSAFEYDKQISRELQLASENCILTNHQNTLTHQFISNNHRTSLHIERVDTADRICKEVTNIEIKLAAALEEKKIAIENMNQLRTEKKQVSGGKKINLKASGRGFPTPAISTEKENFPFPSLSLPSSSYHPTSTEPFYTSLPPELEPPPSSYNVHLSYLQQSRLYMNSEPVFPSATCPPNLCSNQ